MFSWFAPKIYATYAACFGFMFGIAFVSYFSFPQVSFIFAFGSIIISVFCLHFGKCISLRQKHVFIFGLITLFLGTSLFGIYYYRNFIFENQNTVLFQNLKENEKTSLHFTGLISGEIDTRSSYQRMEILLQEYSFAKDKVIYTDSPKILLDLPLYEVVKTGDIIIADCGMEKPKIIEDFDYPSFLLMKGVTALCKNPKLSVSGKKDYWYDDIFVLKQYLTHTVQEKLPDPYAALVAGILWGAKQGLSESISDDFRKSGISHIIAVSGFNITLIGNMVLLALPYCGIGRKKSFFIIVLLLLFFLTLTGLQASVLRAVIMGILALLARQFGRASQMGVVLLLSAAVMLLWNPMMLRYDAGFQLSFLATLGLIYLSPRLEKYFQKIPEMFTLRESLLSTSSAILATLPISIFQFHAFSLVAPLCNILVLWCIPYAMLSGFFIIVFSFISSEISTLFAYLTEIILSWVLLCAHYLSHLPYGYISW